MLQEVTFIGLTKPIWWFVAAVVVLFLQNTTFTLVSRARNSGSYWANFIASHGSNGVWLIAQGLSLKAFFEALDAENWLLVGAVFLAYTELTSAGSVFGQWFYARFIESRSERARVGHRSEKGR